MLKEEEQFAKTLEQGLKLLEGELAQLKGSVIPGEVVFKLYDTYGFPTDLTADIARERDLTIDEAGFEVEMAAQRQRARDAGKFAIDYNSVVKVEGETQFDGYDATQLVKVKLSRSTKMANKLMKCLKVTKRSSY